MSHNTRTISNDAPTGLRLDAARTVAATAPTVTPPVFTAAEKAARIANARTTFDAAHTLLLASEALQADTAMDEAHAAIDMIENTAVRDLMRAALSAQLEKQAAGQRAHYVAMRESLNMILRNL